MNILIIEKKARDRELLLKLLGDKRVQVFAVTDAESGLTYLQHQAFDLIFSDLQGVQFLKRLKQRPEKTPLVFLAEESPPLLHDVQATLHRPFKQKEVEEIFQRLLKTCIAPPQGGCAKPSNERDPMSAWKNSK